MAKSPGPTANENEFKILNEIVGITSFGVAVLLLVSLFFPESVGDMGKWTSERLRIPFGAAAYFLPIILGYFGWRRVKGQTERAFLRGLGALLLLLALPILFYLPTEYEGGYIGFFFGSWLLQHFNLGAYVIDITFLFLGFLLLTESSLWPAFVFLKKLICWPFRLVTWWMAGEGEEEGEEEPLPKKKVAIGKEEPARKLPRIVLPKHTTTEETHPEIEVKGGAVAHYQLPPLSLLSDPTPPSEEELKEDLLATSRLLEETLDDFGIDAKVVQVNRGPVITSFEIQPAAGVKVSRIVSLSDDIALALAAPSIRIEAPIPGKQAVGIEIPNRQAVVVRIKETLAAPVFMKNSSPLTIALGKDITGEPMITDLTKMPHLLIAGATGSGKSVCVNGLINSILYKAFPHEVMLLMVDPKMVELSVYNGLPHLRFPVVTKPKEAVRVLGWLVREMEERYKLLAAEVVRDIDGYNSKRRSKNEEIMPYIVTIIDELADLMMVSAKECEENITRLSQMARAVGIHLVLATQRPSVDVITGVIKANFPSRIAFQVFSKVDSRTILDANGAEKLLGRGDMLFLPVGSPKPVRLQGSFITEKEVEKVVNFIKDQEIHIPRAEIDLASANGSSQADEDLDTLFDEALEIVVTAGYASTSMIQRKLKIGYNRAARLIELMEKEGYVGPPDGSKPREVLGGPGGLAEE